jgi:hypothetical protein
MGHNQPRFVDFLEHDEIDAESFLACMAGLY